LAQEAVWRFNSVRLPDPLQRDIGREVEIIRGRGGASVKLYIQINGLRDEAMICLIFLKNVLVQRERSG